MWSETYKKNNNEKLTFTSTQNEEIERLEKLYKELENPTPRNRAERREQARREKKNKRK